MDVVVVSDKFRINLNDLRFLFQLWMGLAFSSVVYLFLMFFYRINLLTLANPLRSVIQAIGFIFLPMFWWLFILNPNDRWNALRRLFGTEIGMSSRFIVRSLLEGLFIYVFVLFPFFYIGRLWDSRLFSWFNVDENPAVFIYVVGAVISVTSVEFITKGYLMITSIERGISRPLIFASSMCAWLIGHVVEYLWLSVYVPSWYAIILLITAGILSIRSVFNTENILGVWLGHILINFVILLLMNL